MNNAIYPCLTLKGRIAEASAFYQDAFASARVLQTSPIVIQLEVHGQKLMLLNDGPTALPNPSISLMVVAATAEETEHSWNKLSEGAQVLMGLDSYPWSSKYGWLQDKYGVSWQLFTATEEDKTQKICPTMMFTGALAGKATEAVHYYTSVFPGSSVEGILHYSEGEGEPLDYVKHAQFDIDHYTMMAMDSGLDHKFGFNDAISMVVECDNQAQIDQYWDELTHNGGREVACGWLVDRYGVSWQIIPKALTTLLKDPERAQRVMPVLLKMKKLVIADLEQA
ncbi:VOC family protein [Taibaiella chishuiensis]|uniref:Putative 3-demethylubiquinone-9 3-methyltransferase (Glyoxalase superfamily) n=1 Tax=Taibaiella chishuiensis TaxID=1434707 RepID=A0A2P8D1R8_9BACT|nr:VOC family protein [Taibaiella chishuiensis]PSK91164.1 putative 3-demethylubiquinone-9 3-methyltransferase (glyoxalase superfamily) [Taibaiella chishuiensis]